jgi:uncharacterized protein (TIGR00730 family)
VSASVCVFCGSADGASPAYRRAAVELGTALAASGTTLVYGGASVGLMGALADAALDAGGQVIGVLPRDMQERELAHAGLSELHLVDTMHERKARMTDLADGFVALPGGMGTLDELFECLTWRQLGIHAKPVGLFEVEGYFAPLLAWLASAVAAGFVKGPHLTALRVGRSATEVLELVAGHPATGP